MATTVAGRGALSLRTSWVVQAAHIAGQASLSLAVSGVAQSSFITATAALSLSAQGTLSSFGVTGSGAITLHITKAAEWPHTGEQTAAWELNAEQFIYSSGIGLEVPVPMQEFKAYGYDSAIGTAHLDFPAPLVKFYGQDGALGTLNIVVPKPYADLSGMDGAVGTLTIRIPFQRFSFDGAPLVTGILTVAVPPLGLELTGHLSAEGTLTVAIPAAGFHVHGTVTTYTGPVTGEVETELYRNLVLNIRNLALTQFKNYDFNSLCRFNGKHLGATASKIYDLDSGLTDEGTEIEWNFRLGYIDLEQKTKKRIAHAWLSYKSDGDLIATIITPAGDEWEYSVQSVNNTESGVRINFGRGIKSKYVALDIKNVDGSSLDLDTIRLQYDQFDKKR